MSQEFGYSPEEFFGMLGDAADDIDVSSAVSLRYFYDVLEKVMRLSVCQRVSKFHVVFAAGLFAKTDYLVKQLNIDGSIARDFNETRNRIRHIESAENLDRLWAYDLKATVRFISAIYDDATIPKRLTSLFPLAPLQRERRKILATKMRVAVVGVKDDIINATLESTGENVSIKCSETQQYLLPLLTVGCQLNLISPCLSKRDGVTIEASFIILHPDLLVNITSVAACFEDYGTDARLFLFNKIRRPVNTPAIILGNVASKMLDDAVHNRMSQYADSILDFCRHDVLSVASCSSCLGPRFHQEARQQLKHIRNVVNNVMPNEVRGFRPQEVMLEPSFICEMLGIQGRMDMLQLDYTVLVEQKAGKGMYGYGNKPDEQPRQKTKHYVQLLLYMAVLHYNYNIPYSAIYSFLLYSRYEKSLLQLGIAPELLIEAIKVRNQIAWTEYRLANDGFSIYDHLSPDSVNVNASSRSFFERYMRQQLEETIMPIRNGGEVEKAYFRRFMTFIQRECILSRTGLRERDDEGFAQLWLSTTKEKAEAGNIYFSMTVDTERFEFGRQGGVENIFLLFPQTDAVEKGTGISNFRVGDMVVVYPYPSKALPDACKSMVFKATITDITLEGLRLGLRNPQTDVHVFQRNDHSLWAVEHDITDSASSGLFFAISSVLNAPLSRRQLLLSQRMPCTDSTIVLNGDYGDFNQLVTKAMQSRDLFLVIGPPGTGKTSFAMLNILREELTHDGTSVLLLSYTNRAVDEMCGKLVEADIDFIRIGNPLSCEKQYRSYMLEERVGDCRKLDQMVAKIADTRVVCATVSTVNAHPELLQMKSFTLAIVDEASQILEPYIVGLLSATLSDGSVSIGRFVLIGDHKQLPAVVLQDRKESVVEDGLLRSLDIIDCRHSLFQRFLRRYGSDDSVTYMLTRQGRMHRDISLFPSRTFYGGRLEPVPLEHQLRPLASSTGKDVSNDLKPYIELLTTRRVAFIDAPLPTLSPSDKVNAVEADIIAHLTVAAFKLHAESFSPKTTLGIIVPYRNQIVSLRNAIDQYGIAELHDITIDTVERYQGSQRDIIIYGFTVQHKYQLQFLTGNDFEEDGVLIDPKLNVAMTRARENLILVGNSQLLRLDPIFRKVIDEYIVSY
ncbi:MAG: AAA domain-containing protein [Prevotella sp.]